jgi:hypothetical protein
MKRRVVKCLVLFWLGWYLSGPVAETIDIWDPPTEEMRDVLRNVGGIVVLVAAAVCIGLQLLRRLREGFGYLAEALRYHSLPVMLPLTFCLPFRAPLATHSPPVPLRI